MTKRTYGLGPPDPEEGKVFWVGDVPQACDVCGMKIMARFIDGKTKAGPWACMCEGCYTLEGLGLGEGLGQLYVRQPSGRWMKVAG